MKLYGIIGKARVGKDTVAKIFQLAELISNPVHAIALKSFNITREAYILNNLNMDIDFKELTCLQSIAFADSLKECIAKICDIDVECLYCEAFKNSPNNLKLSDDNGHIYTYRELLQRFGTEAGRVISPEIWINSALNKIKGDTIITDVRFENEADAITDAGGLLIRVTRNVDQMEHSSETGLPNYPVKYEIDNNGSIEDLINKVLKIYDNEH